MSVHPRHNLALLDIIKEGGACKGQDTTRFFLDPVKDQAKYASEAVAIRRMCLSCPVSSACLEYALTACSPRVEGIWCATTERARQSMGVRIRRGSAFQHEFEARFFRKGSRRAAHPHR